MKRKFTPDQVRYIRTLLASGESAQSIANTYDVTNSCILDMQSNETYKDPNCYPNWVSVDVSRPPKKEGDIYPQCIIEYEGYRVTIRGVVAEVKVEKTDGVQR